MAEASIRSGRPPREGRDRSGLGCARDRTHPGARALALGLLPGLFALLGRSERTRNSELGLLDELTPIGQLVLEEGERITRTNPAAQRMFGRRPGELQGRALADLVAPPSRPPLVRAFAEANAPGSVSRTVRLEGVDPAGALVPLEVVIGRFPERGGAGYGVVLRDLREQEALVTALTERGAQLARSNRDLQEFTYIASHDLQEPLRMVSSYTQLVGQRYHGRLDASADEFLTFAEEGAKRMQLLLDALVLYSRVDSRGQPFAPTSMDACLTDALRNLRLAIQEAGATIDVGPLPEVEGDAAQLTQVFQNLVANAIKFRGVAAPRVEIRGRDLGAEVEYAVRDNGIGIPPEYREKVFVIFQRLHRREEYPGTGIGLSVAKKVVERHGGTIGVDAADGGGSVFVFRLPKRHAPEIVPATLADATRRRQARQQAIELIRDRLKELV
jgi:PAS domain S-box-containing protein